MIVGFKLRMRSSEKSNREGEMIDGDDSVNFNALVQLIVIVELFSVLRKLQHALKSTNKYISVHT